MTLWHRLIIACCGEDSRNLPAADRARLDAAFAAEEYAGLRLAVWLRFAALIVIAILLSAEIGWPSVLNYLPWLAALALSGYAQLLLRQPKVQRPWMQWFFPLADFAMICAVIVLPNPFDLHPLPPPARLGFDSVMYLALALVLASLGQSVRSVLLATAAAIGTWTLATLYIGMQPGVHTGTGLLLNLPGTAAAAIEPRLANLLDPWCISYGDFARRVVLLGLIGGILAVATLRSRHMMAHQIEAERARRNLSRHFSPHVAKELAQMDEAIGAVKQLDAVVLFADLVGFTRLADELTPAETIALLREVHQRLGQAVAGQQGTLEKYLGDGIMASFGTPQPGPRDASAALLAARAMQHAIDELNARRAARQLVPLQLAIGMHFGSVTLGNVGDETRVEYALVGETVNVAHRLEQMTRKLDAAVCLSDAFAAKLREETRNEPGPLRDMVALRPQAIRGLREKMAIWILPRQRQDATSAPRDGRIAGSPETPPTIH